jgi:hypothetical protein
VLTEWEEGAAREAWDHTAWLCATIANQNPFRGESAKAATPDDFHPFAIRERARKSRSKAEESAAVRMPISILKGFFVKA